MNFSFAGVFTDAAGLWRRERDLLLRVAAALLFLPILATRLFIAPRDTSTQLEGQAALDAAIQWIAANAHWLAAAMLVQLFGSGVILILLLDRDRPSVGEALGKALRRLPALVLSWVMILALTFLGFMLFFVPGMYAVGRTFLVWPVLLAEPGRGPAAALVEGIARSHQRGWMLLLVTLTPLGATYLVAGVIEGFEQALPAGFAGEAARAALELLGAAIGTAGLLGQLLLQASAYRLLTAPRQGT